MDETRRERKKRQTKELLAETAIRLFGEQGYEQTTVAQIASAADVATKTFFNHFPSKEDVLFADTLRRGRVPLDVIADRQPGETVADLLIRAYEAMLADFRVQGVGRDDPALVETYTHLLMTVPALQAKALHLMFDVQREVATALANACPDELDPISAAAAVGALMGATQGVGLASLELGQSEEEFWVSMRRGIDVAVQGLRSL
ncbi:TetR/AcrR family transcriptional regulator [Actinopolymorpha pittospori]|uniref:AcrR family transcriptional regulator n=1 Tax=Actinopolymorpha pittospori TaxID=648752 RepID=A0A927MTM0_9ACTN|nr:TetR/AcrR family transcriptional regulator [Actinopolymorpha pittospori]MBE1605954.1 AcrR family transcriptional regulator [Actinopolymorpha pittospori]